MRSLFEPRPLLRRDELASLAEASFADDAALPSQLSRLEERKDILSRSQRLSVERVVLRQTSLPSRGEVIGPPPFAARCSPCLTCRSLLKLAQQRHPQTRDTPSDTPRAAVRSTHCHTPHYARLTNGLASESLEPAWGGRTPVL